MKIHLFSAVFVLSNFAAAQSTFFGVVKSNDGSVLPGVSILVKGTGIGAISDANGKYTLNASEDATLIFSSVGFITKEIDRNGQLEININMEASLEQLSEVVVVGSRSGGRTKLTTTVPVDIISIDEIMGDMPQIDLAQILTAVAPSFNAVRSQGGDLNSHVDPAQLRNLASNQTLVLINGKRRHSSSILIVRTAVGSPSTAVDMMMIPSTAVERVEILRDGAAAQYGSDAIAGVINIVLKKNKESFSGSLTGGGYLNSGGGAGDLTILGDPDGFNYQLSANYGSGLGANGYLNISGELTQRESTLRPFVNSRTAYDASYLNNERTDKDGNPIITNPELISALAAGDNTLAENLKTEDGLLAARGYTKADVTSNYAGQPAITQGSAFYNVGISLENNLELYSFGGLSYKYVEGFSCFYRRAAQTDRFNYFLYPNGFRPQMTSSQNDFSNTLGIRGLAGVFDFDISNTFGRNSARLGMINALNASLGSNSPVDMYLGTHTFTQNSTNIDFSKYYTSALNGFNLAFGAEMRVENYRIIAGQEESYSFGDAGTFTSPSNNYQLIGPDGLPLEDRNSNPIVDSNGNPLVLNFGQQYVVKGLAARNQCFSGFGPENERNEFRTNIGAYIDLELDITDNLLVAGAARLENYSDFGSVLTGKFSTRYSITRNLALRGSISSGFRAPSLQELNYSHSFTIFLADDTGNLEPVDATTYPTNSTAARAIGLEQLREEKSRNISIGLTSKITRNLEIAVDAYQIDIEDRIFRTRTFTAAEVGNNYDAVIGGGRAGFFVNGADVRSRGLEVVANYKQVFNTSTLTLTLAGIFSENQIIKFNTAELNIANLPEEEIESRFLSRDEVGQFESGVPKEKFIFSAMYTIGKFSSMLRSVYYGEVIGRARNQSGPQGARYYADQTFSTQIVFDLTFSYALTNNIRMTIGGNNIFDTYPDLLRPEIRNFRLYSDYQQGSAGSYYFVRMAFNF